MRRTLSIGTLALLLTSTACGDSVRGSGGATGGGGEGGYGGTGPVAPCPPGELEIDDGSCQPAGIPVGACAAGFVSEDGGCAPILPAEICAPGTMAVPGDSSCREIAPCGTGPWGEIVTDDNTQFVDASYGGLDSDGSELKPWTTIQDGIAVAQDGSVVAVAAGSYTGVLVVDKPITVWGRCPAMVEVSGDPAMGFAVVIAGVNEPALVRGLAVTGPDALVGASGASQASFEQLWIHDTPSAAFTVSEQLGEVGASLRDSLLENNGYNAVGLLGGDTLIERVAIRDTYKAIGLGRGVDLQAGSLTDGQVVIRGSLIERSEEIGAVVLNGASMTVQDTVIRDTVPAAGSEDGPGIVAQGELASLQPSQLVVRGCVIDGTHGVGVLVSGSNALLSTTTIRNTRPRLSDQRFGRGFASQPLPQQGSEIPIVDIASSLLDNNRENSLALILSDAHITSTAVRNTQPAADGGLGIGIAVQHEPTYFPDLIAHAVIEGCAVSRSYTVGLLIAGANAEVTHTRVEDTTPQPSNGGFGDGLTVLSGVNPEQTELLLSSARVLFSHVEGSARAGIANFAGTVALGKSHLECNDIHLNGEGVDDDAFGFQDLGGVSCGCGGEQEVCRVLSEGLAPPLPAEQ